MTDADYTKAVVNQAIDHAQEAQIMFESQIDQAMTELQANMNAARQQTETVQRLLLTSIKKIRDAKSEADSVLRGTSGLVAEAVSFLDASDLDATDNVVKLQRVREEIERLQTQILSILERDNRTILGRIKSAISHLRGYWSVL